MIKTTRMLLEEWRAYANPNAKIRRLVDSGALIPIVKGLYETDRTTPNHCLAAVLCNPSYLSFEFALAWHGLIPEAVYTCTCATFEKKKRKLYQTPFGTFAYRDVPGAVFADGVRLGIENGYRVAVASPEKAICDMLYTVSPRGNLRGLRQLLFEDWRIDEEEFDKLNRADIAVLCEKYRTQNHRLLLSLCKRRQDNGQNACANAPRA